FLAWSSFAARAATRGRIQSAVMAWIAGLCLADAFVLMLLSRLDLTGFAVFGWLVTVVAHRRISGT
ncbi:MAG: hypothetical protein K8E66_11260, partial [Phycisphaerales bacterium]|nr:hypothetical protein [Phycisphaerales bacterium]